MGFVAVVTVLPAASRTATFTVIGPPAAALPGGCIVKASLEGGPTAMVNAALVAPTSPGEVADSV